MAVFRSLRTTLFFSFVEVNKSLAPHLALPRRKSPHTILYIFHQMTGSYPLCVESESALPNARDLHELIRSYMNSNGYGDVAICTMIVEQSHYRAVIWMASKDVVDKLLAQKGLTLPSKHSVSITPAVGVNTNLYCVNSGNAAHDLTTKDLLYKELQSRQCDYTVFDRGNQFLVKFEYSESQDLLQLGAIQLKRIKVDDMYLVSCNWSGTSLTDFESTLLKHRKSILSTTQVSFFLSSLDVCITAVSFTSFSTLVLVCATKLDADLIYSKKTISLGDIGSISVHQVYRSCVSRALNENISLQNIHVYIFWDLEYCNVTTAGDVHTIDRKIMDAMANTLPLGHPKVMYKTAYIVQEKRQSGPEHLTIPLRALDYKLVYKSGHFAVKSAIREDISHMVDNHRSLETTPSVFLVC